MINREVMRMIAVNLYFKERNVSEVRLTHPKSYEDGAGLCLRRFFFALGVPVRNLGGLPGGRRSSFRRLRGGRGAALLGGLLSGFGGLNSGGRRAWEAEAAAVRVVVCASASLWATRQPRHRASGTAPRCEE